MNSKPWIDEYKKFGIPKTFAPYPDQPVSHILDVAAKKFKKNGLIQNDYKMTYPEVRDRAYRFATALLRLGLTKGDRVATILPTSIQFVIADYAIARAGLVHMPCSHLEPAATMYHKFQEAQPEVIICLADQYETARQIMKKVSVKHLILTVLFDYSSELVKISDYSEASEAKDALWMSELINGTPVDLPDISFNVEDDLETLLFTGGTTGVSKGCMLTHRNIYANTIQSMFAMGPVSQLMQGAVSALMGLPMFHSYGHIIMHLLTMLGMDQILISEPRDTAGMIRMIKKHHPVIQFGVPVQFMNLAAESRDAMGMLGVSGSAPLPGGMQESFEKKTSGGIMEGYGLSEMSPCTHLNISLFVRMYGGDAGIWALTAMLGIPGVKRVMNGLLRFMGCRINGYMITRMTNLLISYSRKKTSRSKAERRGTIGIPYPDTEIKIFDPEEKRTLTWEEIKSGRTGEICLSGPQRMKGYWPHPESGVDEEGFVHTSDIVRIDEKGYFFIIDRIKDMINVAGYKVYSREIDDYLYAHPAIEHGAAFGVPDPEREGSERVIVYFKPKNDLWDAVSELEIEGYLKERVAKYAIPRVTRKVRDIPLTAMQKVDKKALREMEKKH